MRSKNAKLNLIFSLTSKIIVILYGLIIPRLIISKFGSNVNGLITSVTQFLAYITLLESGFGPVVTAALYKPIAQKDNNKIKNILKYSETFFRKIAYIFITYIILLAIVYPLVVNTSFDYFFTVSLIIIISISTFAEYYFGMSYRLFLQASQKSYIISIIQIISYSVCLFSMFLMIKLGFSIHMVKLVGCLSFVLRPVLQNIYVKKKYNINLRNVKTNFELKNKWDGLAQHIASVIHNSTDVTLLTIFSTLKEVSVYSIYSLITVGIKSIVAPFSSSIEAAFGDMIAKGEIENLNKKYKIYEIIYYSIIIIIFSCTYILIIPFVKIYTKNVVDINYINETFAIIFVTAEYIYCIRLPYISLTYAGGYFKETKKGAWIEAFLNIIISFALVEKLGIVGVAIGTFVAMFIRALEFMIFSSKNILYRSYLEFIKMIIFAFVSTIIVVYLNRCLIDFKVYNLLDWIKYAILSLIIATSCILVLDYIVFKKYLKNIIVFFNKRRKKHEKNRIK